MKTIKYGILALGMAISVIACNQTPKTTETATTNTEVAGKEIAEANIEKTEFNIEGMTCPMGCAATIENKLASLEGVQDAKVDFENKKAAVSYDKTKLNLEAIATTVTTIGDGHTYKVYNMAKAEGTKDGDKVGNGAKGHTCSADCKKENCTAEMKAKCTPEMKANCPMNKKA